jgi:hypothetical protein
MTEGRATPTIRLGARIHKNRLNFLVGKATRSQNGCYPYYCIKKGDTP